MTHQQQPTIHGYARTVRELLHNKRYGLEYYQREYSWRRTQVEELVNDLTTAFQEQLEPGHRREDVAVYRPYFLGPIITNPRDGTDYLIDGQQRLTTLSLFLIQLLHLLPEDSDLRTEVQKCVYSTKFGKKTFTLDVPERRQCMKALIGGEDFEFSSASASVRNLWARHQDVESLLDVSTDELHPFIDWLLEKVILVEITTTEGNMAYEIFETMNDRGLSLTPTDMLKSYLLAHIEDEERIKASDDFWRDRVKALDDTETNADADFFKAWLRSGYAEAIRKRSKGAKPGDWDLIGTEFHKWVRSQEDKLGLNDPADFDAFVNTRFDRMSRHYLKLLRAQYELTPGLHHSRYNGETGFTLQLTAALAPVTSSDDSEIARKKMEAVAIYLDGLVARRMVNFRNFGYSTMQYAMFNLCKEIRGLGLSPLQELLAEKLRNQDESFDAVTDYRLHQRNGKHIRYLLARITDYVERACNNESVFEQLVDRSRDDPYEIEHIWANKWERHEDQFETVHDFEEARNHFGGLLLLPKSFNASYGSLPYDQKVRHYRGQNLLIAKSLHPDTYERNPAFERFVERSELPFRAYPEEFGRAAMRERQELYRKLCELVWPDDAPLSLDESDEGPHA